MAEGGNGQQGPPMRRVELKTRGMARLVKDGDDRWSILVHVLAIDDQGNEAVVGEAKLSGLAFGPEMLKIVLAQINQVAPQLIAAQTTRIMPAMPVPILPPGARF